MKHIWSILCQNSSIDDKTKLLSIFSCIEELGVTIDKAKGEPLAGRVFGPIPREIAEKGFQGIASKAPEIV